MHLFLPISRLSHPRSRRDANWIEWGDAQTTRMEAEKAYRTLPSTATRAKRMQTLREWLIIALHTLQPPDVCHACRMPPPPPAPSSCSLLPLLVLQRVGVVYAAASSPLERALSPHFFADARASPSRKLRLGMTLTKDLDSAGYTLDMTTARYSEKKPVLAFPPVGNHAYPPISLCLRTETSKFYGPSITSMSRQ